MTGCAGNEPFALRVLGDSMEPEFKEGDIIIVEPGASADDGSYVIALHEGEYFFRKLSIDDGRYVLRALNRKYPAMSAELDMLKGRVVSKSSGRGRQITSLL